MNDETTMTEQATEVPAAPLPSVAVEQKALLAALGRAVVFGNGVKPILAAVQLRAADSLLHVTGCNGEITTDEVVNARCDTPGVFPPVNLKEFTALIRKQPKGVVTLKALPGFRVQVNGALTIIGFDPADYPPLPTREIEPALQLDGPEFVLAAEAALKHASRETSRYAIYGVLIERDENGARLCATDERRLLMYPLKTADGPWKGGLIVTRQHLAAAVNAVKTGNAARVLIRTEPQPENAALGRMVQFSAGGMWLGWSMELEGNFPKYSDVVPPRSGEDAWIISKAELRGALEQVATVCDAEHPGVRLHLNGTCDVYAKGCGGSAELSVPCRYAGDVQGVDMMIGVNPAFLIDAIDALPGEDVRLQAKNMNRAMRVETPELDGPCVVVMPIGIETPDGWEPLPADAIQQAGEHWNVTRAEFAELDWFQRIYGQLEGANLDAALSLHKQSVRVALRLGKPVPAHVLAEYPDLTAETAGAVVVVPDPDGEPAPVQVEANAALAERLEKLADGLQKEIDAKRAPRRENTPKQAREAMSARLDADNLERGQRALRLLARLWREGKVPALLTSLRSKSAILPLVRHRTVSNSYYHVGDSGEYADTSDVGRLLQGLLVGNATAEEQAMDAQAKREAQLREALNEVKFLKIDGYFPTPPAVAAKMIELAQIKPEHLVLEPSAGSGELAVAIRDAVKFDEPTNLRLIEASARLCEILKLRGFDWVTNADFLECQGLTDYHRILMNPPFERGQDVIHVLHAYTLLRPGGRLVSVMSAGTFHGIHRKKVEFCEWLKGLGGEVFDLPAGAFARSGTGVSARLIVVDKPDEPDEPDDQEGYAPHSELTLEEADQLAEARAKKAAEAAKPAEAAPQNAAPADGVIIPLASIKWGGTKPAPAGAVCACCGQPFQKGETVQKARVMVYRHVHHSETRK